MNKFKLLAAVLAALHLTAPAAAGAGGWVWPVRGDVITGFRNGADAYAAGQHRGVDIEARVGEAVVAASSGTVSYVGVAGSSGLTVAVRTGDGQFDTSYLHLSDAFVRKGNAVSAGERIGAVGTSGHRSADAPHLHFGVREAGQRHAYRDPLTLLPVPSRERPAPAPRPAPVPVVVPEPIAPAPAAALAAPSAVPVLPALPGVSLGPAPAARLRPDPRVPASPSRRRGMSPGQPANAPATEAARSPRGNGAMTAPSSATDPSNQGTGPRTAAATSPAGRRPHPAPAGDGHGVDLGWLAACVGLVGAAVALGRSARGTATCHRPSLSIARLKGSHGS